MDKFPLGRVIATAEASAHVTNSDLLKAQVHHGCGDWPTAGLSRTRQVRTWDNGAELRALSHVLT